MAPLLLFHEYVTRNIDKIIISNQIKNDSFFGWTEQFNNNWYNWNDLFFWPDKIKRSKHAVSKFQLMEWNWIQIDCPLKGFNLFRVVIWTLLSLVGVKMYLSSLFEPYFQWRQCWIGRKSSSWLFLLQTTRLLIIFCCDYFFGDYFCPDYFCPDYFCPDYLCPDYFWADFFSCDYFCGDYFCGDYLCGD